jgi:hypothetical protein
MGIVHLAFVGDLTDQPAHWHRRFEHKPAQRSASPHRNRSLSSEAPNLAASRVSSLVNATWTERSCYERRQGRQVMKFCNLYQLHIHSDSGHA